MQPNTIQATNCGQSTKVRDYLTGDEITALRDVVRENRYGVRDELIVLMAYRHGFRVSELIDLQWDQIIMSEKCLRVNRKKQGDSSTQQLGRDELVLLTKLRKETKGAYVFCSERDSLPMQRFAVNKLVERAGRKAGFNFPVHPHMLRHSAGYGLANAGVDTRSIQEYLGHKDIRNTVRYTRLSANRFKGFEDILK
jgi:site-specific recombinase XerD